MRVSWIIVTKDRSELAKRCIDSAIIRASYYDYELLIGDNSSVENSIKAYCESLTPEVYIASDENIGNYQMMNQLIQRSSGELIVTTGHDLSLPDKWMATLVEVYQELPKCGLLGLPYFDPLTWGRVGAKEPSTIINGYECVEATKIFGPTMWSRGVLERIGFFCEDYGLYGHGDSDYSIRSVYAGYKNYYIRDQLSIHLGHDTNEDSEYRKLKWDELSKHQNQYIRNCKSYKTGDVYIPPVKRRLPCQRDLAKDLPNAR